MSVSKQTYQFLLPTNQFVEKHNMRDNREKEMMDVPWKLFEFHHRIPQNERKNNISCSRYFVKFISIGNPDCCYQQYLFPVQVWTKYL